VRPATHDLTDDQLAELALAADPDAPVEDGARPLTEFLGAGADHLLPEWYMPSPGGLSPLTGWRRWSALAVIAAFLLITAHGLCNTYGDMVLH
jgi:hypothetical protein